MSKEHDFERIKMAGFFEGLGEVVGTVAPLGLLALNPFLLPAASGLALMGNRYGARLGKDFDQQLSEYGDKAGKSLKDGGLIENATMIGVPAASLAVPLPGSFPAGIMAANKLQPVAKAVDDALNVKIARANLKKLIQAAGKKKRKTTIGKIKGKVVDAVEKVPETKQQAKDALKKFVKKHKLNEGGPVERAAKYTTVGTGALIPVPGSAYAGVVAAKHVGKLGRKVDHAIARKAVKAVKEG